MHRAINQRINNFFLLLFIDNKIVIPESIAIRLANSSEVTAENFFKHFLKLYQTQKSDDPMIEIKEMKTMPKSAKHVLIDILNPRLPKVLHTTMSSFGESIDERGETSTQAPSTIDFLPKSDNDDDDDDTEMDAETDYESSGQKNWNDTTILLDEDSDRNNV